jgi:hypothetical protein
MEPYREYLTPVDIMAQKLAYMAGVDWERLLNYPGYGRNYWRDEALRMMKQPELPRVH